MADAHFEVPRLAEIYDPLDPDRSDLDAYAAVAGEFSARAVLDIGCGTGTFACLLAGRGLQVTAADPAAASLGVARRKPGAGLVRWVDADATALPPLQVDLVTMTGNVAQVFVTDEEWAAVLAAVHEALRPGGRLVFESRDPAQQAWLEWNRGQTYRRAVFPDAGPVQTWIDLTKVEGSLVSFRTTFVFAPAASSLTRWPRPGWPSTRSGTPPTGPVVSSSLSPGKRHDEAPIRHAASVSRWYHRALDRRPP